MNYISKRKPRAKQAECLAKMRHKVAFALLMAMRTGKTKVILDDFGDLWASELADDLCIIAPAGALPPWLKEIPKEWPDAMFERSRVYLWQSGSKSKKALAEREDFLEYRDGPRVLLINVEALSNVDAARDMLLEFASQRRCVGTIDESTVIKNPTAKRTKFICLQVAPLFVYRRIASGLITPRSPLDLYAQFRFLDKNILGHKSYFTFRARYAVLRRMDFGGRLVDVVVGYRDEDELRRIIEPHSFRVRLEDCYDMPASQYVPIHVDITDEQRRIYNELKEFATAQLTETEHVTATIVITQLLRMHQVLLGHTHDEEGKLHLIAENRTARLIEFLENYDGKAIIWCSYDVDVRKVSEALEKAFGLTAEERRAMALEGKVIPPVCARFWGGNKPTREQEEAVFKTNPACRYIVATPDAGGRGRTWDMANLVIYYSSRDNLEHRAQSEERPKADGKLTPIIYADMIVPGTVETKIIEALRDKIDMSSVINGDTWREWVI
jgi:SNF2 family DNA or RNA helicase